MNNNVKVQAALEAAISYDPAIHEVRCREPQLHRHVAACEQLEADSERVAQRRAQTGEFKPWDGNDGEPLMFGDHP